MAMDLKDFILVFLLVGLGATLFSTFLYGLTDSYSKEIPADYRESFDAFNQSTNRTLDVGRSVEETAHKVEEGAILGGAISGGGAVLKILLLPFDMLSDLNYFIFKAAQIIGIDKSIIWSIYAIILIVIGFLFINFVLRYRHT